MRRIAIALGAASLLALGLPAAAQASSHPIPGSAVPAAAGPNVYSPEQVGYALTGNTFMTVTQTVILPDASKFAANLTGFGESVQLISTNFWAILGVSDSTTISPWSPAFAIFNMTTKALICGHGRPALRHVH
jgi:opacity protein-like surface antigen